MCNAVSGYSYFRLKTWRRNKQISSSSQSKDMRKKKDQERKRVQLEVCQQSYIQNTFIKDILFPAVLHYLAYS